MGDPRVTEFLTLFIFFSHTGRAQVWDIECEAIGPQFHHLDVVSTAQRVICWQIFDPDSQKCYKTDFDSTTAWNPTGWTEVVAAACSL